MRAIEIAAAEGLDHLRLCERPDPGEPTPGQIRVRITGSSINFHDYAVCAGRAPVAQGRIPLSDGAGIVEAVGQNVAEFQVGDRVVSCFFPEWQDGEPRVGDFKSVPGDGVDGFAQETVVRPASAFTHAPSQYNSVEAATITTAGVTAWRAVVAEGSVRPGDTVLLQGTGGVSIWALQLAKMLGATVAITSSSAAKLERAKAMGADFCVNYRETANWGAVVREWSDGRGVDHVIEVGGPATMPQSLEAVRVGGHISCIGVLTGRTGEIPTAAIIGRQVKLHGILVGSRRQQMDFVRALEACNFKPVVDRAFDLAQLADAFRYEEAGTHFGKIAITL